jgi:microcystin degradation protein MlrC
MTQRVAIAQLSHETNVFSSVPTDLAAFEAAGLRFGADILIAETGTNTCIGGFIDAAAEVDFELVPILSVWATPSGIVPGDTIGWLLQRLCEGLRDAAPLDGVLLALHGAMVTERDPDGDALVLERVRASTGDAVPLIATLDLHANISIRMVDAADILIGFDTYPHVDMAERGREAAHLLRRMIDREIEPVVALVKPPMMPTSQRMTTDRNPMRALLETAHRMETAPGVLNVTLAGGFPPADTEDTGASVLVTTDGDSFLAFEIAEQLASELWSRREEFLGGVESSEAAHRAVADHIPGAPPLIVVDIGDNPWTGGPGDSAELLRLFLEWNTSNAAIALIRDEASVRAATTAGPGGRVDLLLGGKTDDLHGPSLAVSGRVQMLSDGRYVNEGPMMAGLSVDLGPTAMIDVEGISVIVTTRAESPIDLNVFRRHGIEPARLDLIGLKGKGHFRAAFEPIASRIMLIEGPGITGADLSRLPFRNVPRPIWPLDPGCGWLEDESDIP